MELRKNIKNKYFLFYISTVVICFILGYVLLVSLDKISSPTIQELFISIYTVFTQFGMLIFSVLIIQTFVVDYKGKNILFYKLMGYDWLHFFSGKVITLFCWMSITTISGILLISLIYQNFLYTAITIFYFECVLIYEIMLSAMWGFLFRNVIVAYVTNFAFWLVGMIASIATPNLSFLARYDASNAVFLRFNQYYNTQNQAYLDVAGNCLYSAALIVLVLGILFIFRKRWEKNGI